LFFFSFFLKLVLFGLPLPIHAVLITTTRFALHHIGDRDAFLWNRMRNVLGFGLLPNIGVEIRLSTVMVSILCFRLVEKYFQDGGNLAIIPPTTNLSSKIQSKCTSSLTRR
jgi:hypothetical protein